MGRMSTITAQQFSIEAGISTRASQEILRKLSRHKILGVAGGMPVAGSGRKPYIYWITKKGYQYLTEEEGLGEFLSEYRPVKMKARWPLMMDHRLATISIIQNLKHGLRTKGAGVSHVLVDWQQAKRFGKTRAATTDFVSDVFTDANKLVPDAVICVVRADNKKMLIFIECDRGTEDLNGKSPTNIKDKLQVYDRYFKSGRFAETYKDWHSFSGCSLLFVTTDTKRIRAIRDKCNTLNKKFHPFTMFSTHELLAEDPLGKIWGNRDAGDKSLRHFDGSV